MNKWVETITKSLRETDVRQIIGHLAEYDYEGELYGKCALGVISCDVGLTLERGKLDPDYDQIMLRAKVPREFINDHILPNVLATYSGTEGPSLYISETETDDLSVHIFTLNDRGFTFEQIADFLETTYGDVED